MGLRADQRPVVTIRPNPVRRRWGRRDEHLMLASLDEIADAIYRISTFVPEVGPKGFTFNQFLLTTEEPCCITPA